MKRALIVATLLLVLGVLFVWFWSLQATPAGSDLSIQDPQAAKSFATSQLLSETMSESNADTRQASNSPRKEEEKSPWTIEGIVLDEKEKPISNCRIVAVPASALNPSTADPSVPRYRGRAGGGGYFAIAFPEKPETYLLVAEAKGYREKQNLVSLPTRDPLIIILDEKRFTGAEVLNGRVIDPQGKPVHSFSVGFIEHKIFVSEDSDEKSSVGRALLGLDKKQVQSEDGTFAIKLSGFTSREDVRELRLFVRAKGYAPHLSELIQDPSQEIEVVLQPGDAILRGVVRSASTGSVVSGAKISFEIDSVSWEESSDAEGKFEIAGLPRDRSIAFTFRGEGHAPEIREPALQGEDWLEVILGSGNSVFGEVVGSTGDPLSQATVFFQELSEAAGRDSPGIFHVSIPKGQKQKTQSDGSFSFLGIPDGRYLVGVEEQSSVIANFKRKSLCRVLDLEGSKTVQLRLGGNPVGTISGSFEFFNLSMPSGELGSRFDGLVAVFLIPRKDGEIAKEDLFGASYKTFIDKQSQFLFPDVELGNYQIVFAPYEEAFYSVPVDLQENPAQDLGRLIVFSNYDVLLTETEKATLPLEARDRIERIRKDLAAK